MQPGTRVGQFEILAAVGAGGMGQVFSARDTKLGRNVAIKALPADFATDPDRLARLEREAKALAAVSHPNIASIHELLEHEGGRLLVLELVDGQTLAERLQDGPLPLAETLDIAQQIAAALESAHEHGVVHRDLKPANVMLTPDGLVKVLDFGLAKSIAVPDSSDGQAYETEVGTVLGTAPYMSPEQARGEEAGRQSDIWSFGVMLYEMLTGESPFERPSAPETIAHVLVSEPDLAKLPEGTPAALKRLIRRCLEKTTKRRIRDFGDIRLDLEDVNAERMTPVLPSTSRRRPALSLAAVALVALAALAALFAWLGADRSATAPTREVVRLALPSLGPRALQAYGTRAIAIADAGTHVAYASSTGLRIRRLSNQGTLNLDGPAFNPFFSPNGEWIGYYRENRISVLPIDGGRATIVAESTERPAGATWTTGGEIVFATASGLYSAPADRRAAPRLLARPNREAGELLYAWPEAVADGNCIVFTIVSEDAGAEPGLALLELDSLETRPLLSAASSARWATTGHLLFIRNGELVAVAFDPVSCSVQGDPTTVADVSIATSADNFAAEYDVAASGTLIYVAPSDQTGLPLRELLWVDRDGVEEALPLPPETYIYPRVSPDGTRIAFERTTQGNRDIWIYDWRRQVQTRFTSGPTEDMLSMWSPDGSRIYFSSNSEGNFDIYSKPADASTEARVELVRPEFETPQFITADGELVIFEEFSNASVLNLSDKSVRPLLHRESRDVPRGLSPDGRWMAYESDESGSQWEVYLRPYPDVMARREQVSVDGGRFPVWGPPGSNELYFVDLEGAMMAAEVEFGPDLSLGTPIKLFDDATAAATAGLSGVTYDVSMVDGRFIIVRDVARGGGASGVPTVSVVLNWLDELERQVAAQN